MKVILYTTPTCGYCHQAKAYLGERSIRYIDYDVSRDSRAAEEMVRVSGQMGVPVIVVDGEVIVGFNRLRLDQLLTNARRHEPIAFGLGVADAGKQTLQHGDMNALGALVGKVAPSSLGERAGLKRGDIIIRLNRKEVHGVSDLEDSINDLNKGDRVVMDILRGRDTIRSEVII